MEIYKLLKRKLKVAVIKVLSILRKVMHEQSDKFNKEIKNTRRYQIEFRVEEYNN